MFYIFWFVVFVLAATILGGMVSLLPIETEDPFTLGLQVGTAFSVVGSLILGTLLIRAKGLVSPGYIALVVLAGVLSLIGGALLGLLPLAYLTTQERR